MSIFIDNTHLLRDIEGLQGEKFLEVLQIEAVTL